MNGNNIASEIQHIKNKYYQENRKNILFTTKQTFDCASNISNTLDINSLFRNTFYIIKNTQFLYFDYTIFKNYITPDSFDSLVQYAINLIQGMIEKHGHIYLHINIDTYSITAHERYKNLYPAFFNKCLEANINIDTQIKGIFVYNAPNVLTTLTPFFSVLLGKNTLQNVFTYNKHESNLLLNKLFE
jgi:hypothetical protein